MGDSFNFAELYPPLDETEIFMRAITGGSFGKVYVNDV